jgi:hypothetical protein
VLCFLGEEIFMCYGNKQNELLMMYSGFSGEQPSLATAL